MKKILSFLLCMALSVPCFGANLSALNGKTISGWNGKTWGTTSGNVNAWNGLLASGGGGGPNTWYWAGTGLGDTDFDTGKTDAGWYHMAYLCGGEISVAQSGTATKLAVKVDSSVGPWSFKLGLYTTGNSLLAQCSGNIAAAGDIWAECTINQAVSAGTYRVFYSASQANGSMYYEGDGSGLYGTCAYADAMCNPPTAIGSETYGYAVKVFVQ